MQGDVVLITGGSSGIGMAAARRFVDGGARVWLTARDESKLSAAVAQLGPSSYAFPADVTDPGALDRLVNELRQREGRLDILLNSAGQLHLAPVEESAAEWAERLMKVNYLGLIRVVAATLPLLRAGSRRSIVNLSSFVGRLAPPYWSAYAASKHAVQGYTNALRQELRREGFHVGLILPGPVQSAMTDGLLDTPYYPIPFGVPIIQPPTVAEAIVSCVRKRRSEVTVPGRFGPLLRLASAFPGLVDILYRFYSPAHVPGVSEQRPEAVPQLRRP